MPDHMVMTTPYKGIVNAIGTQVKLGYAHLPSEEPRHFPEQFSAIWDTGATRSTIKTSVAERLNLPTTGPATVLGVGGEYITQKYLASLLLPNNIAITEIELLGCDNSLHCDMLIGMDIITLGDFLISNSDGKTVFSFSIPSIAGGLNLAGIMAYTGANGTDYIHPENLAKLQAYSATASPASRNSKCPCGSGKKYKKCCGHPAKR